MAVTWDKFKEYLFYSLVFLLPWQTRWIVRDPLIHGEVWEYGRVSIYSWDILLVVLLIICLPGIVQEIKNLKFLILNLKLSFEIFKNPILIYFLLLLFTLASLIWAQDKIPALAWVLRLVEVGAVWFLVRTLKPKLSNIFLSLSLAGVTQALWAIGQFITQSTLANKWLGVAVHPLTQYGTSVVLTDSLRLLRAYAGQVHPNVLGGLLVITCLATVWLISGIKSQELRIKNNILMGLYIIQLVALFFTFSRGAWLALLIALLVWLFISTWVNLRLIIKITILVFITLGIVLWSPTVGRIFGGSRLEIKSVNERVTSVQDSQNIISANWLVGVGLGNYTYTLQQFVPGQKANYYQPVHNIFLLILAELGIVGLGLMLWLIKRLVFSSQFVICNSLFLIPVLVTSLFDHYWWTMPSMFLLFGSLLVLLYEDQCEVG